MAEAEARTLAAGFQEESPPAEPSEALNLAVDPAAIPASQGKQLPLSEAQRAALGKEIHDILSAYDQAMQSRWDREAKINDAYNLVHDADTSGQQPGAQQMVSEMTRSYVNIATARLVEGMLGTRPFVRVEVWDDQARGEEAQELAEEARATEEFWDNYFPNEMRGEVWQPMAIHRATKRGDCAVRVSWDIKKKQYKYKKAGGGVGESNRKEGRVKATLINTEQLVVWPLTGLDLADQMVVGHRSYETLSSWRALGKKLELSQIDIDTVSAHCVGGGEPDHTRLERDDSEGKDVNLTGLNPFEGEVGITELWLQDYVLPGETEARNYQLFYYEPLQRVLWINTNPYYCQRHGYFLIPYWREDNSIFSSGIGHEVMYNQKADSAMWNLLLDNLKVIGNHLRIIKSNSLAEANQDEVMPGGVILTEKPDEDFRTEPLGGDLSWILEASQQNEMRGMKGAGIPNPIQGLADPVLKSGASPGSYQQLIDQAGKRFGQIDRNMRQSFSDICLFSVELLQQYGPAEIFYTRSSEESAQRLVRGKFKVPMRDLRSTFRMIPKAPSATSNREVMLQRLMITYQITAQHLPTFMQLIDQTIGLTNPAGAQQVKDGLVQFFHNDLYSAVVESQEISGLASGMPKVEDPTPIEQQMNELIQENQMLQQQLQELMMQGGQNVLPGPGLEAAPAG